MKNENQTKVTRLFINGVLEGLTHTEITTAKFEVGQVVEKSIGGCGYKIVAVEQV